MKNILCFGDSNTYGLKPDGTGRYDFSIRYPGVLQSTLGTDYHIIEEGCPGRTTVFDDKTRPFKNGIDYIVPSVLSHTPLDYVVIMLGTNDCKTAYNASAEMITAGLAKIIDAVKCNTTAFVIIVSPVYLGEKIGTDGYDKEFDSKSIETCKQLADKYNILAKQSGCGFIDASEVSVASDIDNEHLDEIGHYNLGRKVAEYIISIEEKQFH